MHATGQGQVGDSFSAGLIVEGKHTEQPVLEVLIRKVSDKIKNLLSNLLCHGLTALVKLGLARGHSLQMELGFGLHKPRLDVLWPKQRKFHSNSVE